jgi:hypothetical protein
MIGFMTILLFSSNAFCGSIQRFLLLDASPKLDSPPQTGAMWAIIPRVGALVSSGVCLDDK